MKTTLSILFCFAAIACGKEEDIYNPIEGRCVSCDAIPNETDNNPIVSVKTIIITPDELMFFCTEKNTTCESIKSIYVLNNTEESVTIQQPIVKGKQFAIVGDTNKYPFELPSQYFMQLNIGFNWTLETSYGALGVPTSDTLLGINMIGKFFLLDM
jgi:hypothetical protein